MTERLGKYIVAFDYADNTCFAYTKEWLLHCLICNCYCYTRLNSGRKRCFSGFFSYEFSLKERGNIKNLKKGSKHNKIVLLWSGKLSSIKKYNNKPLTVVGNNHEGFNLITFKEEKYRKLKENTRKIKDQRGDIKK